MESEQLELIVIEGTKQGARIDLPSDIVTTVGVGYDCDIVLDLPSLYTAVPQHSSGQAERSEPGEDLPVVELLKEGNSLNLKVLQGSVMINDQTVESGVESLLDVNTTVRVHNNVFVVRSESSELDDYTRYADSETDQNIVSSNHLSAAPEQQRKRVFVGAAQSIAGILVLGGAAWAYTNAETETPVKINDVVTGVEFDLEKGGFSDLNVVLEDDNTIAINGYLQHRSDLHKAREQVQTNEFLDWDVKLGESLAESVGSVYRVNGIAAEVAVIGEGVVSVNTVTDDLDLLQRIEENVYRDVSDLQELELINEPPVKEEEVPDANRLDDIPGKRIVMIVASEPTFIQTEDGSRYFEGSILPSGHLITAILDEKVQLLLDGKQIELSF